jgi:hypothetical protein
MPYGLAIDLDAIKCVDLGHRWTETFYGRAPAGKRRGNPIRCCVCDTCGSGRIEYLKWDGKVFDRDYDPDDAYLANARLLGPFRDRRTVLRKAKNDRLKKEGNRGELNGQYD